MGPTKRGKGTKIMVVADGHGLPLAAWTTSASPHEVTLVEKTLDSRWLPEAPVIMMGDRAYDSDALDQILRREHGVELVAPHRAGRKRPKTQDGRVLRRYRRRWKIERLFAWLHNFRRVVVRWERKLQNYRTFVLLACMIILLRQF